MRKGNRSQTVRYVLCFLVAMLGHAGMFAHVALLAGNEAAIKAQKGDAWVELQFTRPKQSPVPEEPSPRPEKALSERMAEPEPPKPADFEPPSLPDIDPEAFLPPPLRNAEPRPSVAPDDLPQLLDEAEPADSRPAGPPEASAAFSPETAGVREAVILGTSQPRYPPACERGLHRPDGKPCEGTSVFLIEVFPDGRIREVQLLSSAGCRHLDEAVRKWFRTTARAEPARDALGRPIHSEKLCRVKFVVPRDGRP